MTSPYLTDLIPPIACAVKHIPSDFIVEEVPAFLPSGEGQHLWMWIEKEGLTTDAALGVLGRHLGVPRRKFRVGGKKDARAITRQWVSLDLPPKDYAELLGPLESGRCDKGTMRLIETKLHRTAHGLGRTHGNRFRIRLRGVARDRVSDLRLVFGELERRGVPNYFGPQRFGHRGDTDQIGEAIWRGRDVEAVELICGRPMEADTGRWLEARRAFENGDLAQSRQAWSRGDFAPKQLLRSLVQSGEGVTDASARCAVDSLDRREMAFFMAAFQARLFNQVLARRVSRLDQVWEGDLALRLPGARRAFLVEDQTSEQVRADAGEITASGPLFGLKMPSPTGRAGELEALVLDENDWSAESMATPRAKLCPGARRPLRIPLLDLSITEVEAPIGLCIEVNFQLPKGSFATSVLAEVHKGLGNSSSALRQL